MTSKLLLAFILFLVLAISCTPQIESELGTRAVELGQTAVAEGADIAKTAAAEAIATGASAAQTAAAEGLSSVETRVAEEVGSCPPSFDVETDLNLVVPVTGQEIDQAISAIRPDSGLIGLGDDIVRIGNEKGINSYYIAAHAALESAWGNSALAQQKNNLFGYGAYDTCAFECAWTFDSKAESVEIVMTNVKKDYLTEGGRYYEGPNLKGMNVHYATDSNWQNGIASIMNSLATRVPCD